MIAVHMLNNSNTCRNLVFHCFDSSLYILFVIYTVFWPMDENSFNPSGQCGLNTPFRA